MFAAGYFLSYLYRTVNAVLGPVIARELDLPDHALGLLTSTYFLAFGLAQLPLGILLDRTDIEEELTRFGGHLEHLRKTLQDGGPVGRKLEFLLQELGREINTLGNKATITAPDKTITQAV
mgnify:CR=1 FL=1